MVPTPLNLHRGSTDCFYQTIPHLAKYRQHQPMNSNIIHYRMRSSRTTEKEEVATSILGVRSCSKYAHRRTAIQLVSCCCQENILHQWLGGGGEEASSTNINPASNVEEEVQTYINGPSGKPLNFITSGKSFVNKKSRCLDGLSSLKGHSQGIL